MMLRGGETRRRFLIRRGLGEWERKDDVFVLSNLERVRLEGLRRRDLASSATAVCRVAECQRRLGVVHDWRVYYVGRSVARRRYGFGGRVGMRAAARLAFSRNSAPARAAPVPVVSDGFYRRGG